MEDIRIFVSFSTAAAAENVVHDEEDSLTSPVKNLQKKTDLFQLQKVTPQCVEESMLSGLHHRCVGLR